MKNENRSFVAGAGRNIVVLLAALCALKLALMCAFTSDFQGKFFIPFVDHYLGSFDNPWEYFHRNLALGVEFPYAPFMLYILSFFYAPVHFLGLKNVVVQNFFFKLPLLMMDITVLTLLFRLGFDKARTLVFYFAAPIIFYAAYMHSQLDLIPTGLLFCSVFCLIRSRHLTAGLLFGLALATKMHVLVAFPIMAVFIWRSSGTLAVLRFAAATAGIFAAMVIPFLGEGFSAMVLNNPQQSLLFDAFINIGNGKLYITVLGLVVIVGRFMSFQRINKDILYAFLALIFAALVAFLIPGPGWYVWLFPFISIFFIKAGEAKRSLSGLFWWFNLIALVCVVIFYDRGLNDLIFLGVPIGLKVASPLMKNITATLLTSTLIGCMYLFYKRGIKSNFFYRHDGATIIAIAGDSASGKTTLMHDLKKLFGRKILLLEGDADHKWERQDEMWSQLTHLNPKANDLYRQFEDLLDLKYGRAVRRRDYDHGTGKFTQRRRVVACDYIALSGLHAFYLPKMRKIADVKIFLDTEQDLRASWKVSRDSRERGYALAAVASQMASREEDAKKYIQPQRALADLVIGYSTSGSGLKLTAAFNSNIRAEQLVEALKPGMEIGWDYSDDLRTQIISFKGDISAAEIGRLALTLISNADDLVGSDDIWEGGYRGLVQLMTLLIISETIRSGAGKEIDEV